MAEEPLRAIRTGILNLGGYKISCAVLENHKRVLVEKSMALALGKRGSGAYFRTRKKGVHDQKGAILPQYVSVKYIQEFMSKELRGKLESPIEYINRQGKLTAGVDATVLPDICDLWITARDKGALDEKQTETANRAYILMRGFANVGIIALIDEVTHFQEIRDELALQEILDKYLLPYKAAWAKRFPNSFYQKLFRLKGWPYDPTSVKRPSIIGTMTNDIVYARLAPGVLEELKARTPKDEKGRRKHRYHQLLTEDVGHPKLQEHLLKAEVLMDANPTNYTSFHRALQRALPRLNETVPMDIPED